MRQTLELVVAADRDAAARAGFNTKTRRLPTRSDLRVWWPMLGLEALTGSRFDRVTVLDVALNAHEVDFIQACTLYTPTPILIGLVVGKA